MLRSEAITIIKRGLGFRQTQDAAIIAALKQAQRDAELGQTLPNFLLAFDQPIVVTADDPIVALPNGFIRFADDYVPYYVNSDLVIVTLPRRHNLEAKDAYLTSNADYPQVFVQQTKTRGYLVPTPKTSFTIYVTAYKAADVLDSEMENAWLANAPNYLVGMAGVHVAGDVRDRGAMEKFNTMARIGQKALLGDIVEDELAGRPLIMGRNN
jgi:hypothetical protein